MVEIFWKTDPLVTACTAESQYVIEQKASKNMLIDPFKLMNQDWSQVSNQIP